MTRRSAVLANLLLSLPMITGLLGAAPNASAQTNQMTVTIPFDFTVGNHHLAAGSYSVEQVSGYALQVRNNQTRNSIFLMVRGEDRRGSVSTSRLVFERAGKGVYLTQAWFAGTNDHVQAVAKLKRDLEQHAKQNSSAPSTIEVASK